MPEMWNQRAPLEDRLPVELVGLGEGDGGPVAVVDHGRGTLGRACLHEVDAQAAGPADDVVGLDLHRAQGADGGIAERVRRQGRDVARPQPVVGHRYGHVGLTTGERRLQRAGLWNRRSWPGDFSRIMISPSVTTSGRSMEVVMDSGYYWMSGVIIPGARREPGASRVPANWPRPYDSSVSLRRSQPGTNSGSILARSYGCPASRSQSRSIPAFDDHDIDIDSAEQAVP